MDFSKNVSQVEINVEYSTLFMDFYIGSRSLENAFKFQRNLVKCKWKIKIIDPECVKLTTKAFSKLKILFEY